MSNSTISKVENVGATNPLVKKLKVMDYVFCYKGVDMNNAILEYNFSKIEHLKVEYNYGKKKNEELSYSSVIDFSIKADDTFKKTYIFDFMINMDLDMLNKMSAKPTNINKYVLQGEVFFTNPYVQGIEFMNFYEEENIYQFTPSFWVQKINYNKYAFKIQYQDLFIWFHVEFNKN